MPVLTQQSWLASTRAPDPAVPVDLHSIFELAVGLHNCRTQLPLAVDFDFFQNVDLVSGPVLSHIQHGGDCPVLKKFRAKLRGWTPIQGVPPAFELSQT
jgi:hypothetical protein